MYRYGNEIIGCEGLGGGGGGGKDCFWVWGFFLEWIEMF